MDIICKSSHDFLGFYFLFDIPGGLAIVIEDDILIFIHNMLFHRFLFLVFFVPFYIDNIFF